MGLPGTDVRNAGCPKPSLEGSELAQRGPPHRFFGLPVSTLSGGNVAYQVADLKGQLKAIDQAGLSKRCSGRGTAAVAAVAAVAEPETERYAASYTSLPRGVTPPYEGGSAVELLGIGHALVLSAGLADAEVAQRSHPVQSVPHAGGVLAVVASERVGRGSGLLRSSELFYLRTGTAAGHNVMGAVLRFEIITRWLKIEVGLVG